ncbi:hypothetical protein [uncultured Tateyamaria sp.]|uniref:hypothetical protein n=1 Tax=uncultured Tateyamaria sp. TaxID=455651 RepID=UPI00263705E3|nr:hypothetical protein [uncultured Tateyamaria sp.]
MTRSDRNRLETEQALRLVNVIYDGVERVVRIIVDGTRVSDETARPDTGNETLDGIIGASHAIDVLPGCRQYTIAFEDVVAVQIRDESYAEVEREEDYFRPLRHYPASRFLTHMRDATFAEAVLNQPLVHWAVVTLDDVIDIAAQPGDVPAVSSRVLTATELWADPD